jgi:hypothetical protein
MATKNAKGTGTKAEADFWTELTGLRKAFTE